MGVKIALKFLRIFKKAGNGVNNISYSGKLSHL